jgi:tRNA(Ile)-lysidine synthase
MCSSGDRVAVAVSGGADSVCLLHILHELAPTLGIELSVAHLNHRLRGPDSEEDAEFVADLAAKLRLPLHLHQVYVGDSGDNLEQAGRNARIEFFDSLPVDRIATGHTRSDQAETVLYRLLRGSGTAGLAGVLPVVGRRIRPLIDCDRSHVAGYLAERNLCWREDASNANTHFARNHIRHEILPRLPDAVATVLARTAELARDEEDYWAAEISQIARKLFRRNRKAVLLHTEELIALPIAVQRRLIRNVIQEVKGNLRAVDLHHIESILRLAHAVDGHGRTQIPGIDCFRSFEFLRIDRPRTETRFERDYSMPLDIPSTNIIPRQDSVVKVEVVESRYNNEDEWLDLDRVSGPWELRNWHPGDQFTRAGHSSEKIKTLFQLARIPIWDRQGWPVITCGDRIVWTRRFGVSSEFAAGSESRRLLHIEEVLQSAESKLLDSASTY